MHTHLRLFKPIKDFKQCVLRIVVVDIEPFIIVNKSTPEWTVRGIEIELLGVLTKRLNFQYHILFPPVNESRGEVYPNGSANGAIGMVSKKMKKVLEKQTDLFFRL